MTKKSSIIAALTFATALTGCSTTTKSINNYTTSVSTAGLTQLTGELPTLVYVRSGAPALNTYNRFIIDPVRIDYSDPAMKELDADQLAEMQSRLQEAVVSELVSGGYQVGTRSAPGTMRISMTIANLKAPSAAANVSTAFLPFALSVGEVTVEAVFRPSDSNRIDAVVVNRAEGNRLLNSKPWTTWSDAEKSFKEWAVGIRKAVASGR